MVNGKSKGSEYERQICKYLTKWISGMEKPYIFWRSPSSGSLATLGGSPDTSGDIIAIKDDGKWFTNIFSVELKNGYPDADFHKHFKDTKSNIIEDFWCQCITDAKLKNKKAMLIFKKKGLNSIVGIGEDVFNQLKSFPNKYIKIKFNDTPSIIFFDFEKFFEINKPDDIKKIK